MQEKESLRQNKTKAAFFVKGKMDLTFFFLVLGILTTGLVMLFSASAPYALTYEGNSYHFITRQLIFALIGLLAMYFVSRVNYHWFKNLTWPIFIVSLAMLVAVLFLPEVVPGFKRWLAIGPITFQPSEVAKFALILILAYYMSRYNERMKETKFIFKMMGFIAVVCGLIIAEKHLSATILVFMIGMVLLFVGGMKLRFIAGLVGVGAAGGVVAIATGLIGYGSDRIQYWLHPWDDPLGKGFQTIQSLLAIGSGGVMGQGIGESKQKYLWVPEPQNDFIFSIVCEELGLIGALLIIAAFALLFWRGFVIALSAPDKFGAYLSIGLSFQVALQAALNILVVTNTIPNTGISLPFFSYGGTSLVMLLFQMGIILSVSRQSNLQKK